MPYLSNFEYATAFDNIYFMQGTHDILNFEYLGSSLEKN